MTALADNEEPLQPDGETDLSGPTLPDLLATSNSQKPLRVIHLSELHHQSASQSQPVRRFSDLLEGREEPSATIMPFPTRRAQARVDAPDQQSEAASRPVPSDQWQAPPESLAAERLKRRLAAEHQQISKIARVVSQCAFEVLSGNRSLTQMNRWLDLPTMERLRERVSLTLAGPQTASTRVKRTTTVRRSRLCRISDDVYEATVTVQCHDRIRAAALRLERRRGQWRVNALELG